MKLKELGTEYLKESELIRQQINLLRPKLKTATGIELINIRRKLTVLYEMAEDCNNIGKHLHNYYS